MNKRIGIYKITNLLTGQSYVGQSTDLAQRKIDHFKYSARNAQPLELHHDIFKYGKENFVFHIIEECTPDELDEHEEFWINYYKKCLAYKLYNISMKANPHDDVNVKKTISNITRKRNIKSWSDPKYRVERSKFSSDLQKKRLKDPKYLAEKSKQLKKYTDSKKKKVYQYDLNWNLVATYNGTREAERTTGFNAASISEVARQEGRGRRKTYKKFNWRYHSVKM